MAGNKKIVFVGRLEKDTGLLQFLKWLDKNKGYKVDFAGDGALKSECKKYGTVHGFINTSAFIKQADICVPAGYLSYIEARAVGCKIMVFPNNPLKRDYWQEIEKVKRFPTWGQVADEYLSLYHNLK